MSTGKLPLGALATAFPAVVPARLDFRSVFPQDVSGRIRAAFGDEARGRGLDGSRRFRTVNEALRVALDALREYGVQAARSGATVADSARGTVAVPLAWARPGRPVPISNASLALRWRSAAGGGYVVHAYLT